MGRVLVQRVAQCSTLGRSDGSDDDGREDRRSETSFDGSSDLSEAGGACCAGAGTARTRRHTVIVLLYYGMVVVVRVLYFSYLLNYVSIAQMDPPGAKKEERVRGDGVNCAP